MSSLNRIILVGTLNADPEIRLTTSGESLGKFTLVVERPDRGEGMPRQSDWIQVVAWRQLAEKVQSFQKGQAVLVEGRISTRSYDDNQGQRQYVTEVEAKEINSVSGGDSLPALSQPATAKREKAPRETQTKAVPAMAESEFDFGDQGFSPEEVQFPNGFDAIDVKEIEDEVPF